MATFENEIDALNGNTPFTTETGIAGENILKGDVCYYNEVDLYWYKSTSIDKSKCSSELRIATETILAFNSGIFMSFGDIILPATTLVTGNKYYVGETPGTITNTISTNLDYYYRYIGTARNITTLMFNPDQIYIKVSGNEINGVNINNRFTSISISSNYSSSIYDSILADTTSSNITITLPDASINKNSEIHIKKIDSSANDVIIDTGGELIEGNSQLLLSTQWDSVILISNGINWFIL